MATNFPSSLDNFTNPVSGNTLDSPSHSLQHSDANDAIEAIEAKLGVGASPAGSATAGQVLTISAAGTSAWTTPNAGGLVLIKSETFTSVSSVNINDVFSSTYQNYRIVTQSVNASAGAWRWRLRVAGADDTNNVYVSAYSYEQVGGAGTGRVTDGATQSWTISQSANQTASNAVIDIFRPFETTPTYATFMNMNRDTVDYIYVGGLIFTNSTSFTGFTIFPANGVANATGTIRVYGYKQ